MPPKTQPDHRRLSTDIHHQASFEAITELPWDDPSSDPLPNAQMPIAFADSAPDMARKGLREAAEQTERRQWEQITMAKKTGRE